MNTSEVICENTETETTGATHCIADADQATRHAITVGSGDIRWLTVAAR